MRKVALLAFAFVSPFAMPLLAQDQAPPPTSPFFNPTSAARAPLTSPAAATAPQLYSIGDPTPEEQQYVEYINRARANPVAEATRLSNTTDGDVLRAYKVFGVSVPLLATQLALVPAMPPLSINAKLLASARLHSHDMFDHQFQDHNGTDGSTPAKRMTDQGYSYFTAGENIFSFAYSTFYGHAGFEVDWGGDPVLQGGMQTPPGHRDNIHDIAYREIGVGVVDGRNGAVGPQVVTQDFGSVGSAKPFVTGVVYFDQNNNGFYDVGEGIGGVSVTVSGNSYYAVTSASGGYSVPLPGNGTYLISFSGGGIPDAQQSASVVNSQNVKVDYVTATRPTGTPTPTPAATATPTPAQSQTALGNISTRMNVGIGNDVLIGGFIVTGTQAKKVIVRAIGPSLSIAGRLDDPTLELYSSGTLIASNDNWIDAPNKQAIIDSTIPPSNDFESAILTQLAPGAYTAIVRGANQTTGVGLVEVYDLDQTVDSRLAQISTRGSVQTGDNVMIGGLYVVGSGAQKVIVRAIGPSLPVDGKLLDPQLELRDGNGTIIDSNDNWRSDQEAKIIATTVTPSDDAESAIVQTLTPGPYTAVVRGVGNATGVALVEVYALQ
jgi:hypothetical protein